MPGQRIFNCTGASGDTFVQAWFGLDRLKLSQNLKMRAKTGQNSILPLH